MNFEKDIQHIVIDYFKDVDNKTLVLVIDSFVYHKPITDKKNPAGKIITDFLKDNGLVNAHLNYLYDYRKIQDKTSIWKRSVHSESHMIEMVKSAMLNCAYNRFRNIDHTPAVPQKLKQADKIKILGTSEIEKSVHIVCNINSDYALCSILLDGDMAGDTEPTTDKVDCKHCLSIAKMCKSIEL